MYMCTYIYIYIYTYRESDRERDREREREREIYSCIQLWMSLSLSISLSLSLSLSIYIHKQRVYGSYMYTWLRRPPPIIGTFTFTGWSFVGKSLSEFVPIKVFVKQTHTKAAIVGKNRLFQQVHTNKAPTNQGKSPYSDLQQIISCVSNLSQPSL